jgi:polygalacturonase
LRKRAEARSSCPAGKYFTGLVDLCNGINLHLEAGAIIVFSANPDDYRTEPNKYRPLLLTKSAHDVIISGAGTIDGGGAAWWTEARRFKAEARANGSNKDTSPRPNLIGFERCQRVRMEGVTVTNSPKFNVVPNRCTDLTFDGITIVNPADSPNTDGIDPSVSQRILITHCTIDTGR